MEDQLAKEWARCLCDDSEATYDGERFSTEARAEVERIVLRKLEALYDELSSTDLLLTYYMMGGR